MLKSVSLTLKMILLTILVGIVVWGLMDSIHSRAIKKIINSQLSESLSKNAQQDRINFDNYARSLYAASKVIVTQKKFLDYFAKQDWSGDEGRIKYYSEKPEWLPRSSVLRTFTNARYYLLLDNKGRVRELFQDWPEEIPPTLLQPSNQLRLLSINQFFMTAIDGIPFLIASETARDENGNDQLTLMLATPLDNEFLVSMQGSYRLENIVALVGGDKLQVVASSNPELLVKGVFIDQLTSSYLVTGKSFFDYGASDMHLQFTTFISMKEYNLLTESILMTERNNRAISGVVLILSFAMIMFWITKHIQKLTERIVNFSVSALGAKRKEIKAEDELYILEKQFQNLTSEVIAANKLIKQEAEERNRVIVNNSLDAIITIDDNDTILTWNPRAKDILGYSRDEALGKNLYEMIVPQHLQDMQEKSIKHFFSMAEGGESSVNAQVEITVCSRNKREFPVELSMASVLSDKSTIFVCNIRDITERKQAEIDLAKYREHLEEMVRERTRELEKAHKELLKSEKLSVLGQLTATVSHELRNPLGVIQSSNYYLQTKLQNVDDKIIKHLNRIDNQVLRCDSIVGDLLEYTRGTVAEPTSEDIISWLEGIMDHVKIPKGVTLSYEPPVKLPRANFDREKMRRVMFNLIDNAVMAISDRQEKWSNDVEYQPQINISASTKDENVSIILKDNGIGMDTETANHAFEPLFTTRARGTGLGLAIVKKTIDELGGSISLDTQPDIGTAVNLIFPAIYEQTEHSEEGGANEGPNFTG